MQRFTRESAGLLILAAIALACPESATVPDGNAPISDASSDSAVVDARSDSGVVDARSDSGVVDARSESGVVDARTESGIHDARSDGNGADAFVDGGASDRPADSGGQADAQTDAVVGQDAASVDQGAPDGWTADVVTDQGVATDATVGIDTGPVCTAAAECQDGLYCNGYEACAPGAPGADSRGCLAGTPPCTGVCDEGELRCTPTLCEVGRCESHADCSDYDPCNGMEFCAPGGASCVAGTPIVCGAAAICLVADGRCHCFDDADCSDGVFCNGAERCVDGVCAAGTAPCAAGRACDENLDQCHCTEGAQCQDNYHCNGVEYCHMTTLLCMPALLPWNCGARTCMEAHDACGDCTSDADCSDGCAWNGIERCRNLDCDPPAWECSACMDCDGDGALGVADGGADCDDNDADRYPGALEVCDLDDEDCDPFTIGNRDVDGDGFIDHLCCNGGRCGEDCEDQRRASNPNAGEVCIGWDDDCDGTVDEAVAVQQYRDRDGDGDGDPACSEWGCVGRAGWATYGTDCDDTRPSIGENAAVCAPDGAGAYLCTAGQWVPTACPPGTTCHEQFGGLGACY